MTAPPPDSVQHGPAPAQAPSAGHPVLATHAGVAGEPATAARAATPVSLRVLTATIVTLLTLTALTVSATVIDFGGAANLWIAMVIATAKATLVALYFMHLRYDRPFNAVVLLAALLFLVVFIGLTLTDTLHYRSDVQRYRNEDVTRYAPALERY